MHGEPVSACSARLDDTNVKRRTIVDANIEGRIVKQAATGCLVGWVKVGDAGLTTVCRG